MEGRDSPTHTRMVVRALATKASALLGLDRHADALVVWDEILKRFGTNNSPTIVDMVSGALVGKGAALIGLTRFEEALEVWDDVLGRPICSDDPTVEHPFSVALAQKSMLLDTLGRKEEGLALRNEAMQHLSKSDEPRLALAAAKALLRIGESLVDQRRFQEALSVWDEVMQCIGTVDSPVVRDWEAVILASKGDTFAIMSRPDDALTAWDDVVRRFGLSDTATAQEAVTTSLVHRGSLLVDLKRPQDALETMDDLIRRLGSTSRELTSRSAITSVLLGKARALADMNRLQEAVAVYDEVLERHSGGTTADSVGPFAAALVAKGAVLVALDRPSAALTTLYDAVRLCGTSDHPMLQHGVKLAQLKIAELHLRMRQGEESVAAADRLFKPVSPQSPELECQGHLIRARAHLLQKDKAACMLDVDAALSILSDLDSLPSETLDGLCWLAVELGPAQLRELIVASPASRILFPLTTALEKELGLETWVAKEIEEVAEDIRRGFEDRRKATVAE